MKHTKNSKGFIYVLKNPSLKGMVKIGVTTKDPSKKCEELSSTSIIPTPFKVVYSQPSKNPFKVLNIVHTILDEFRVYKDSDFFNVDVEQTINLIQDIIKIFYNNYNVNSKGRYEAVGFGLENRPFLAKKRFNKVEELTSLGIDGRFIWDNKEHRCLSMGYIPELDRPKLEVK